MTDDPFKNLMTVSDKLPRINTQVPLALFYKQRLTDQVLYTMVQSGKIKTFEAPDYQQPHQDIDFELMYVLKGQLTNFLENREFIFHAGEGCLLNPQITHSEILDSDCQVLFINLSQPLLYELLPPEQADGPIFNFLNENLKSKNQWRRSYLEFTQSLPVSNQDLKIILDSLQQEVATTKIGARYFQHGLVLRLLKTLEDSRRFKINEVQLDLTQEDYLVNRTIHLIENHFGQLSREKLAKELHYNAEYLNRLLKKQTGQTINAYAQQVRLQKAQQLLVTTDLTVAVITEQLGFNSQTYFYHYFKKQTNLSPNQYRTKYQEF